MTLYNESKLVRMTMKNHELIYSRIVRGMSTMLLDQERTISQHLAIILRADQLLESWGIDSSVLMPKYHESILHLITSLDMSNKSIRVSNS